MHLLYSQNMLPFLASGPSRVLGQYHLVKSSAWEHALIKASASAGDVAE